MKRSHPLLVWFVLAVFILALGLVFIRRSPKHVREPGAKPYDVAVYDVYSDLLHAETTERPWLERLLDPRPDGVLIRIDTTVEGSGHGGALDNQAACIGDLKQQGLDGEEASSACVDYVRPIKQPFQLQKKFSLSRYELVTRKEEHALLEDKGNERESRACLELAQTYPNYYRLVELSAVGFNKDQTVAYLYFVEWNPSRHLCQGGVFGHGGPRILYKENGKWRRPAQRPFTDWVTFLDKPELTTVAADTGVLADLLGPSLQDVLATLVFRTRFQP